MNAQKTAHEGLDLFTRLLDIPAPSGYEKAMAEFLMGWLREEGYAPETDPAGNVLVRLEGRNPEGSLCCIAAHTDEIAMTVRKIESDGSLRVARSGGLFAWKLGETPVDVIGRRGTIRGVVSFGSGHSKADAEQGASWSHARVLTGLDLQALEDRGITPGTPVVPVREMRGPFVFGSDQAPWAAAWSFDNRLAVAVLLLALRRIRAEGLRPQCPMIVAFTVQEEVGCHGAKILAVRERPEIFIAVDGSPLVPESPLVLDGRPSIRTKDRSAVYDPDLVEEIRRLSSAVGIDMQTVVYDGASSDASQVTSIGASPRAACFGYVRESSHGYEATPLATFDHLLTAVTAVIGGLRGVAETKDS